jgi:putative ABC transport system substrate-binding protein
MSNKKVFFILAIFLIAIGVVIYIIANPFGQQQQTKVFHVGLLQMASTVNENIVGFKAGMEKLGYKENENIIYDYRNAEGNMDSLNTYTKELVAEKPDMIFTNTSPATQAMKDATAANAIPVVFSMVADPVRAGFVASIQSSGNNLTGTECAYIDIAPKRLEFLKLAFPAIKKVLVFYRPGDKSGEPAAQEIKKAGQKLGVDVITKPITSSDEIKTALNNLKPGDVDAMMDPADSMVTASVDSLVQASQRLKIPLMMLSDLEADKGATITYGVDYNDLGQQSSALADKVLKGTKPADIPIEMPRTFRIVLNLKAASQLGLAIPGELVARANRVIR